MKKAVDTEFIIRRSAIDAAPRKLCVLAEKLSYEGGMPKRGKSKAAFLISNKTGLQEVYKLPHNSYGLYGMAGNMSEWTFDSTGCYIISGSWKTPGSDFTAVCYPESGTYQYPRTDIKIPGGQINDASAVTGFRLGMDRVGGFRIKLKKKRRNSFLI